MTEVKGYVVILCNIDILFENLQQCRSGCWALLMLQNCIHLLLFLAQMLPTPTFSFPFVEQCELKTMNFVCFCQFQFAPIMHEFNLISIQILNSISYLEILIIMVFTTIVRWIRQHNAKLFSLFSFFSLSSKLKLTWVCGKVFKFKVVHVSKFLNLSFVFSFF